MSLHESLDIAGRLTLRLRTADGRPVREVIAHNDITVHGRRLVAQLFNPRMADTGVPRITRICVGSDGKEFDPQDNALGKRVGWTAIDEVEELEATDTGGRPRRMLRMTGELGEGDGNGELREAGLFTDDEQVMYNRVRFPTITKSPEFRLTLVWEITF